MLSRHSHGRHLWKSRSSAADSPLLNSPDGGPQYYPGEPTNPLFYTFALLGGCRSCGAVWLDRARANTNNTAGAATKR